MQVNFNLFNLYDLKSKVNKFFIDITDKTRNTSALMFFTLILFILCFVLALSSVFKSPREKIVVFDFQTTYTAFLNAATHRGLSQDEIAALGKQFPTAVTQAVNIYAEKHNAIVFTKAAVMAGTKKTRDATYEIQQLIAREMQVLTRNTGNVNTEKELGRTAQKKVEGNK